MLDGKEEEKKRGSRLTSAFITKTCKDVGEKDK